jgi:TP901-1 family phage major tail protein
MAAQHGTVGRLIRVWAGDVGGALSEVAGCQEKSFTFGSEPIDVTADEDDGWRRLLDVPAMSQLDLSVSGILRSAQIKQWVFARDVIKDFEFRNTKDGSKVSGTFVIASYEEGATYNDKVTFTMSLQSDGPVVYTPGP